MTDDLLQELCDQLGLTFAPQDWGIENSDGARVQEFIDYYNRRLAELHSTQRFQLVELIVASANDAMVEGSLDPALLSQLGRIAKSRHEAESIVLDYWARLDDDLEEFPVAAVVRDARSGAQ